MIAAVSGPSRRRILLYGAVVGSVAYAIPLTRWLLGPNAAQALSRSGYPVATVWLLVLSVGIAVVVHVRRVHRPAPHGRRSRPGRPGAPRRPAQTPEARTPITVPCVTVAARKTLVTGPAFVLRVPRTTRVPDVRPVPGRPWTSSRPRLLRFSGATLLHHAPADRQRRRDRVRDLARLVRGPDVPGRPTRGAGHVLTT